MPVVSDCLCLKSFLECFVLHCLLWSRYSRLDHDTNYVVQVLECAVIVGCLGTVCKICNDDCGYDV